MVVKYWDMRQPNPMAQLQATDRVYALDAVNDLMVRSVGQRVDDTDACKQVFGTADRQISIVDLKNPGVIKSVGSSGFDNGIAVDDPHSGKGIAVEDADEGDYRLPGRRWLCRR